jgi:CheY-like chemotaxis protein
MSAAIELGTVSELASAIAWPLVALCIVVIFRKPIAKLLDSDDVTVTGPAGLSLSAKRSATNALEQAASRSGDRVDPGELRAGVEEMSEDVEALGRRPRVLWVDDVPDNNRHERAALEALGISIDLSTSTRDALSEVEAHGPYDLIISDMGRPPDPRAGYTLLDALRSRGDFTPFVIYAGSRDQRHFDEAVSHGALGSTNRPTELIEMVSNALRAAARRNARRPRSGLRKGR